jgi:hypothetical protein
MRRWTDLFSRQIDAQPQMTAEEAGQELRGTLLKTARQLEDFQQHLTIMATSAEKAGKTTLHGQIADAGYTAQRFLEQAYKLMDLSLRKPEWKAWTASEQKALKTLSKTMKHYFRASPKALMEQAAQGYTFLEANTLACNMLVGTLKSAPAATGHGPATAVFVANPEFTEATHDLGHTALQCCDFTRHHAVTAALSAHTASQEKFGRA